MKFKSDFEEILCVDEDVKESLRYNMIFEEYQIRPREPYHTCE